MSYYTLVTKEAGRWCPQFADRDRQVVVEERIEYRGFQTKIIKTQSSRQYLIDREIAKLNAAEAKLNAGKLTVVER